MHAVRAARIWLCLALMVLASVLDGHRRFASAEELATATNGPLLLRLFLIDGSTLVSYGEPARMGAPCFTPDTGFTTGFTTV